MTNKPRVQIVGLGAMGERHVAAAQQNGYDIIGLCDVQEERLQHIANCYQLGKAEFFTSFDAMLAAQGADLIIIATTADTHYEFCLRNLQNKIPYILCEKPMTVSDLQAETLVQEAGKTKTRFAINHFHRFNPLFLRLKDLLEEGKIGNVTSVNVFAGNFGLAMNGSHFIDVFKILTGEKIQTVSARFSEEKVVNPRGARFEDRAGCLTGYNSKGQRFFMDASADNGHGIHLVITGNSGIIFCDYLSGDVRITARTQENFDLPSTAYGTQAEILEEKVETVDVVKLSACMQKALISNENYFSAEEGRDIIELLVCAHFSNDHQNGFIKPEDLDDMYKNKEFPWA